MNGNSFMIDTLMNGVFSVPTLIENGCECLAAVNDSIVRKANLPRIKITPRKITGAVKNDEKLDSVISQMTKFELDIYGYLRTIYAFIIPHLSEELILGKPWMEREDVIYLANEHWMEIREAIIDNRPLRVQEKDFNLRSSKTRSNITGLSVGVFLATVRRIRKTQGGTASKLLSVTLADIQKALSPSKKSKTDLERLPPQYTRFSGLFKKECADKLQPHRQKADHKIEIENGNEVPWGLLYGMSRYELLILRKTLTELLN